MKKILLMIMSLVMSAAMVGCTTTSSEMSMKTVEGTISYRERIAMPENAVVTVVLEDISRADALSIVLATQSFKTEGKQVPFNYTLQYSPADIIDNHRYSVRAKIEIDGKLRFTTDTSYGVITDADSTHQQDLRLVSVGH
jgi:putative lipoprotein